MPILYELKDHVARVTIDRPDVLNAIDAASERELQKIWDEIETNRGVRVVVLTGTGERAFSTGADMKGGSGASGLEYWALSRPGGFGGIALRDTLDVPVIARTDNGAQVSTSSTQRATAASSSARGTTSLTSPIRSASAAEIRFPVSSRPIAR